MNALVRNITEISLSSFPQPTPPRSAVEFMFYLPSLNMLLSSVPCRRRIPGPTPGVREPIRHLSAPTQKHNEEQWAYQGVYNVPY